MSGRAGRGARGPRPGRARRGAGEEPVAVREPLWGPPRGWRGRGGGRAAVIEAPGLWRGTTVQANGLWPFVAGSGSPLVGAPLGRNLFSGAMVCCDPVSWFTRASLVGNPSCFVLGNPGLGKSTAIRRMVTFLAACGVVPFVLGDLKPDYPPLVEALGGQVIRLGRGRGGVNVLDLGEAPAAAARLRAAGREDLAGQVLADARGRRANLVSALVTIVRHDRPSDREETVIATALDLLDRRREGAPPPVMADLLRTVQDRPPELSEVAIDRGDEAKYRQMTEGVEASLMALCGAGRLGDSFARPTATPMLRDRAVVFDLSAIEDSDDDLQAAALMACWSTGFGAVGVAQTLADAGLEPRRNHFVVSDELWRALRLGHGMVDRYDAVSRLNRTLGVGKADLSHTIKDLTSMPEVSDQQKAKGLVERSGLLLLGGLPRSEMALLREVVDLSDAEADLLVSWSSPPAFDTRRQGLAEPPGRGNFLIKVGGRPGIPVHIDLTAAELAVNDTNQRWHD